MEKKELPDKCLLSAVENPVYPDQFIVTFDTSEFICYCPISRLEDRYQLKIQYIPGRTLLEIGSLRAYLDSYKRIHMFNELVFNRILRDLADLLTPKWMKVEGTFRTRHSITHTTSVEHNPDNRPV